MSTKIPANPDQSVVGAPIPRGKIVPPSTDSALIVGQPLVKTATLLSAPTEPLLAAQNRHSFPSTGSKISTVLHPEFKAKDFLRFVIDRHPEVACKFPDLEFEFNTIQHLEQLETWDLRKLIEEILTNTKEPSPITVESLQLATRSTLICSVMRTFGTAYPSLITGAYSDEMKTLTSEQFLHQQYNLRTTLPGRQIASLRQARHPPEHSRVPAAGAPKRDASPKRK